MNGQKASFRSGFTLMELLVVIAIIALLVSILMPSLQAAKSLARTTVCQANMHRIALGNGMYMGDNEGFSVHGREMWNWYEMSPYVPGSPDSPRDTGYQQSFHPTQYIDDDFPGTQRGVGIPSGGWSLMEPRNQFNNGGQNFPGTGGLMYEKYIEESAAAIGCPQADFTEVTAFSGDGWSAQLKHNYQYIKFFMSIPRMDPAKNYSNPDPNFSDPNAYWRNDYYDPSASVWKGRLYASSYIVRGPLFRSGDIVDQSNGYEAISYFMGYISPHATRGKADSQVAIFADHEWAGSWLGQFEAAGLIPGPKYDKPAWKYFPRRHTQGPVVAYTDGHVAVFQDESRRKTWNHDNPGKYSDNQTKDYGNGWAMIVHIFDEK